MPVLAPPQQSKVQLALRYLRYPWVWIHILGFKQRWIENIFLKKSGKLWEAKLESAMYQQLSALHLHLFSSVQLLRHVWLFATPWAAARQASLSNTNSRSPPKLMSIESVMPTNRLILCRPILLLPSVLPSIKIFSNESVLHQVTKVLEFQLQHQSFRWTPRTDLL